MLIPMKKIKSVPVFSCVKAFFIVFLLAVFAACVTNTSNIKPEKRLPAEKVSVKEPEPEQPPIKPEKKIIPEEKIAAPTPLKKLHKDKPLPPASLTIEKSDQEKLDSALELCHASNDYWEQGNLENAIETLDQAYSLILKVNGNAANPEIFQQKEDIRFTISKRIIEVYASRISIANGHRNAIPMVMNRHVQKALNLFKGRERKFFLNAYARSGKYRPDILKSLKEAGLPQELSWLPLIESGFKVRAFSRARALGMWQFIASTGYKFGLKRDMWIDERMDPKKSTKAAIAYLKELHRIFGDWTTALAAYNCGEGSVLRRIRTQKINYLDNFWDLYQKLPSETAFYVPKFLAVLQIINDPEGHGITLPPLEKEIETDTVAINRQIHLKTMSKYLGVSYGVLKNLNPELRHNSTPNKSYAFKVPKGNGELLLSKLGQIPVWRPPVSTYVRHKVRNGESLSKIASRYKTTVRAIMELNRLKSRRYIKAGWKLKIPTKKAYKYVKKTPKPVLYSKTKGKRTEYVVKSGDSLWKIAKRFGTTTRAIKSLNQLSNNRLRIGQVLLLSKASTIRKGMKTKNYKVSEGDSPGKIAKRHKMKLSELLRINNLTHQSTIFPNQRLLVKAR